LAAAADATQYHETNAASYGSPTMNDRSACIGQHRPYDVHTFHGNPPLPCETLRPKCAIRVSLVSGGGVTSGGSGGKLLRVTAKIIREKDEDVAK